MKAEVVKVETKEIKPLFKETVAPKEMKIAPVGKLAYVVETYPIPSDNIQEQGNITFVASFYAKPRIIERSRKDSSTGVSNTTKLETYGKLYIKCAGFSVGPYSQRFVNGKLETNWRSKVGSGGFEIIKNSDGELEVQVGDLLQHVNHQSWQISGPGSLHNYIMSFLRDSFDGLQKDIAKDPERFKIIEASAATTKEDIDEADKQIMNQLTEAAVEMPE